MERWGEGETVCIEVKGWGGGHSLGGGVDGGGGKENVPLSDEAMLQDIVGKEAGSVVHE